MDPKSIGIIGAEGFIGSNLHRLALSLGYRVTPIDSRGDQYETARGEIYDQLFFCAGNSKVYISNIDPLTCLEQSVMQLSRYLMEIRTKKFIFLSTSLVYPANTDRREDALINIFDLDFYGMHKLVGEFHTRNLKKNFLIVRPTGFFGPELKKNFLFDLKNKNEIRVHPESYIDYMEIGRFAVALLELASLEDCGVYNVGSGFPLKISNYLDKYADVKFSTKLRLIDDRGYCLDKLNKLRPLYTCREDLEVQVLDYLSQ